MKCLPGTALKKTLLLFGIRETSGCNCGSEALKMDELGCDWADENIELIVDFLGHRAKERSIPFVRAFARMLVQHAIRKARQDALKDLTPNRVR